MNTTEDAVHVQCWEASRSPRVVPESAVPRICPGCRCQLDGFLPWTGGRYGDHGWDDCERCGSRIKINDTDFEPAFIDYICLPKGELRPDYQWLYTGEHIRYSLSHGYLVHGPAFDLIREHTGLDLRAVVFASPRHKLELGALAQMCADRFGWIREYQYPGPIVHRFPPSVVHWRNIVFSALAMFRRSAFSLGNTTWGTA